MAATIKRKVESVLKQVEEVTHGHKNTKSLLNPPSYILPSHGLLSFRTSDTEDACFVELPFSLPESDFNESDMDKDNLIVVKDDLKVNRENLIINEILNLSLHQQYENEFSDNCAFVTQVVYMCLKALSIDCRICYGYRYLGYPNRQPHMWLNVKGYNIDNTYSRELCPKALQMLRDDYKTCYEEVKESEFEKTEQFPPPKDDPKVDGEYVRQIFMKKRIDFYRKQPDMALALSINRQHAYNYFFTMVRYLHQRFDGVVEGIHPKVRYMCWGCEKFPRSGIPYISDVIDEGSCEKVTDPQTGYTMGSSWKFFQCSQCMVANYCSRRCQKADWNKRHNVNCLSREYNSLPKLGDLPFGPGVSI